MTSDEADRYERLKRALIGCGRGYVPVSEIHGPLFALHQYCMNHPENIRDLPDEIWLPFCGVVCATEKLKEGK